MKKPALTRISQLFPLDPHPAFHLRQGYGGQVGHPHPLPRARGLALSPGEK